MPFTITWKFGGSSEKQQFDDKEVAYQEAFERSEAYAKEYGLCETEFVSDEGQVTHMRSMI